MDLTLLPIAARPLVCTTHITLQDLKKGKSKAILVHATKVYRRSGSIAPLLLKLGTGWRRMVSVMRRSLYSQQRAPSLVLIE